jgi:hypothetical protein
MAAENIGNIFPTKIPALGDVADIQEALRLYHYGSTEYDPANTDKSQLPVPSMAHTIKVLEDDITALEDAGIGSGFLDTKPEDVPDGFIWVDSTSSGQVSLKFPSVFYQDEEPTEDITEGMLWVEKSSDPLTMYVYDNDLGWRAIGSSVPPIPEFPDPPTEGEES